MQTETVHGPAWITEFFQPATREFIRRTFATIAEVTAYETDKPMGVRSWNVPAGQSESFLPVEVLQ